MCASYVVSRFNAWVSIQNKQFQQERRKKKAKEHERKNQKKQKTKGNQNQLSLISLISSNLQDLASAQTHPSISTYSLSSRSSGRLHWAWSSAPSYPWNVHTNAICKSSDKSKDNSLSEAPGQYMTDATELAVKLQVESECFFYFIYCYCLLYTSDAADEMD